MKSYRSRPKKTNRGRERADAERRRRKKERRAESRRFEWKAQYSRMQRSSHLLLAFPQAISASMAIGWVEEEAALSFQR